MGPPVVGLSSPAMLSIPLRRSLAMQDSHPQLSPRAPNVWHTHGLVTQETLSSFECSIPLRCHSAKSYMEAGAFVLFAKQVAGVLRPAIHVQVAIEHQSRPCGIVWRPFTGGPPEQTRPQLVPCLAGWTRFTDWRQAASEGGPARGTPTWTLRLASPSGGCDCPPRSARRAPGHPSPPLLNGIAANPPLTDWEADRQAWWWVGAATPS